MSLSPTLSNNEKVEQRNI